MINNYKNPIWLVTNAVFESRNENVCSYAMEEHSFNMTV